jgi:hypothetical protein
VPGYKFSIFVTIFSIFDCSHSVLLPALLDDIGLTSTDMWSGGEISVGRTNFTQFAEEIALECGW